MSPRLEQMQDYFVGEKITFWSFLVKLRVCLSIFLIMIKFLKSQIKEMTCGFWLEEFLTYIDSITEAVILCAKFPPQANHGFFNSRHIYINAFDNKNKRIL